MKIVFMILVLQLTLVCQSAASIPAVFQKLPADAAYALVLDKPAVLIENIKGVLAPFRSLHEDLDIDKLGQKLKKEIGTNLLTAEGMTLFGIDPQGVIAIYGPDFESEATLAIKLLDSKRFVQMMTQLMKNDGKTVSQPQKIARANVYSIPGAFQFALLDNWCLLPPKNKRPLINKLKAFFGPGSKIAADKLLNKTLNEIVPAPPLVFYLPSRSILKAWQREQRIHLSRTKDKNQARKIRSVEKSFSAFIKQSNLLVVAAHFEPKMIRSRLVIHTTPRARKTLRKVLSSQSASPAFQIDITKSSIASGWAAFDLKNFLSWLRPVPVQPTKTLGQEMDDTAHKINNTIGLDLENELLLGLKDPIASYWLVPSFDRFRSDAALDKQISSITNFLFVTGVRNSTMINRSFNKMRKFVKKKKNISFTTQNNIHALEIEGLILNWTIQEGALLIGIGQDTLQRGMKALAKPASGQPKSTVQGKAHWDYGLLTETISQAVSKGIGGSQAIQFRMMWPLVQQVLAKFGLFGAELTFQDDQIVIRVKQEFN